MFKIPKKYSLMISIALSAVFFAVCVAGVFFAPGLSRLFISMKEHVSDVTFAPEAGYGLVLTMAYFIILVAMLADIQLFALLLRVKDGLVFTAKSTSLVRGISWCCFFLCAVVCVLGIYFKLAFVVAFAALLLGICLRVVKNVLEEATEIKCENDLTV